MQRTNFPLGINKSVYSILFLSNATHVPRQGLVPLQLGSTEPGTNKKKEKKNTQQLTSWPLTSSTPSGRTTLRPVGVHGGACVVETLLENYLDSWEKPHPPDHNNSHDGHSFQLKLLKKMYLRVSHSAQSTNKTLGEHARTDRFNPVC